MGSRKTYHVVPDSTGGWKVQGENAKRAVANYDTKQLAVERAKELAKAQPEGKVVIHKQDGKIQTEHTYGNDPFPPKG